MSSPVMNSLSNNFLQRLNVFDSPAEVVPGTQLQKQNFNVKHATMLAKIHNNLGLLQVLYWMPVGPDPVRKWISAKICSGFKEDDITEFCWIKT